MTTWTELADALHNAAGPSRDLDARLWQLLGNHATPSRYDSDGTPHYTGASFPFFTDTLHIGQIIKVIGDRLPGWGYTCTSRSPAVAYACVNAPGAVVEIVRGESATPALAICEAFCRAMAAKETGQ